jgi:hypothetical protein
MLNIKGVYGYTVVSTSAADAVAVAALDDDDLINVDVCCANAAPPTVIPNIHTMSCFFIL